MKTDTMIRTEGMRLLRQSLGLVEAEKFIMLLRREPFDYTDWQQDLWPGKTLDEIFEAARDYERHSSAP